jgi:dUTPase
MSYFLNLCPLVDDLLELYESIVDSYNNNDNAGFDIPLPDTFNVEPGINDLVDLRVLVSLQKDDKFLKFYLLPRSSLRKHKLSLINSIGLIDPQYRYYPVDTLKASFYSYSKVFYKIDYKTKLLQVDCPTIDKPIARLLNSDDWLRYCQPDTARGGFGSTGN